MTKDLVNLIYINNNEMISYGLDYIWIHIYDISC